MHIHLEHVYTSPRQEYFIPLAVIFVILFTYFNLTNVFCFLIFVVQCTCICY